MRTLQSWLLVGLLVVVVPAAAAWARGDDERRDESPDRDRGDEDIPRGDRTEQEILFVPLLSLDRESIDAGRDLSRELYVGLAELPHLRVFQLKDVPEVFETDAALYMRGCPQHEELGCQLVLGEKVGADRVVSGTVVEERGLLSISITFLHVELAEMEYSFEVRLEPGEIGTLVEAVELTLEELADPFDAGEAVDAAVLAEQEREELREKKERAAMRVLELVLPDTAFEELESSRRIRRPRVSWAELQEQEDSELISTDWEDVGLTRSQYMRWNNSRRDLSEWKAREANHFLQPLIGFGVGYMFGPMGLEFIGNTVLDPDTLAVIDSRSVLAPKRSSGFHLAATLGFGVTPLFDFECTGSVSFSRLAVLLNRYEVDPDDPGALVSPLVPADSESEIRLWGLAFKLRFFPTPQWRVKPTIAGGFGLLWYPNLGNPERYADFHGPWYYAPAVPFTDQMLVIEPGAVIELGKYFSITADVSVNISVRTPESRLFVVDPYEGNTALDPYVEAPTAPKPVYVLFRIGAQLRPLPPRFPEPAVKDEFDVGP